MADEQYNRNSVLDLIKAFTGQTNILTIPRVFIDYTRSLDAALILSQLLYWSDRAGPDGWFYKSYTNWREETTLGEHEVRKAIKLFKSNALVTTKIQKVNGNPTLHYKFHFDRFSDSLLHFLKERKPILLRKEGGENTETLHTEITTEITTEIKGADALPAPLSADTSNDAQIETVMVLPASKPVAVSTKKRSKKNVTPEKAPLHPAVKAVRELGAYPQTVVYPNLITTLGDEFDREKLNDCAAAWASRGYKLMNLGWVFDWYVNGIPISRNGAHHQEQSAWQGGGR